jgi:ATP-dependent RNA helicase DeaD
MTRKSFERKMVPGGKEICEKQLLNLVDKVENTVVDQVNIEKYLPAIYQKLEWLDREELIKHFISVEFNRFLEYYKDAPDLNIVGRDKQTALLSRSDISFARFHINLGTKHNLTASSLISLINRNCHGKRIEFGKIEILRNFSFFEIEQSRVNQLLSDMNKVLYDGFSVTLQLSVPQAHLTNKNAEANLFTEGKRVSGKKRKKIRNW